MRGSMLRSLAGLSVLVALGSGVSALAAETGSLEGLEARIAQGPGLPDLLGYAYRASPMIQSARSQWKATVEKYRVDTGYPDPQVMLEGMYLTETLGENAKPDEWTARLTQMIPLPGRLGKAGEVTKAEARVARLKLDQAVRDVTTQIRESYQELLYVRDAKGIASENRRLLEQLRKVGETSYAQNRAALVDVVKAQSQSAQLQYDALLLDQLERTEKTRMNSLLSREPDAEIGPLRDEPALPVAYALDEIFRLSETHREEIRMAQAEIEKARAMEDLARYETLPELELGLSYNKRDLGNQAGIQAGFTLPLWWGKNAGRKERARSEAEGARAMRTSQVNDARAMIRDTYFRLQNSERLLRLYRDELLPQAARSLELAETWYRQGQGSFADYVEVEAVWYNFRLALARANADYGKFLSRLEALAGRSLTEREKQDQQEGAR